MRTLIRDAVIVSDGERRRGTVLIEDERIADVISDGCATPTADEVVEAADMFLLPGVIDEHVHFRDPGMPHKADMSSESAAAVAGGVTSVMDMPNTIPQTTTVDALEDKLSRCARSMHTNYSAYIGATNDNASEVLRADYGRTCGVKVFMGSSTGGMLVDSGRSLEQIFRNAPTIIATHCEDESIVRANSELARARLGDDVPWAMHSAIRSAEACYASSAMAAGLARETGARLHIMHVTTAAELSLLDRGTERKVTGEACLAHLWFTEDDYARLGAFIKCNPSIKTAQDRGALRQAVAEGVISTVGTDHAPHALDEKVGKPYWSTPSGMPMIQHSLPLMLRMADEGCWSYETVAQRMAGDVADLYGIESRGYIRPGMYADLVLLRRQPTVIDDVLYKCGWSPLRGERLNHVVVPTYVSGRTAYADGRVLPTLGKELRFLGRG